MSVFRTSLLGFVAILALAGAVTEQTTTAWGRAVVVWALLGVGWILTRLQQS